MKPIAQALFLLLFLMGFQSGMAQSGFGLRVGANSADQSISALSVNLNPKSKLGFDLAVFYNHDLDNGLAIQPEIHYSQMGFKVDIVGIFDLKADLGYIRIPILIKYDVLSTNPNIALSPFVAPYLGILASEDVDVLSLLSSNLPYKSADVGFDFGLMFSMESGFFLDVRYVLGLTNVLDLPVGEIKNKALSFGLGYRF
jgi:hypothetical protein